MSDFRREQSGPVHPRGVSLILGGVRSGKSRYAEQAARDHASVLYVATAQARDDDEMRAKIARHRAERSEHWITVEEPVALGRVVMSAAQDVTCILIDCLTVFAANLLERFGEQTDATHPEVDDLCKAIASSRARVLLVSNEVGSGIVPAYALGRKFRDLLGEINQRIAGAADLVVYMVAGLPLVLKGSLLP